MKEKILQIGKKTAMTVYLFLSMAMQRAPVIVNANPKKESTGAEAVTSSLNDFYSIVAAFVSATGAIILLWGVFEWGTSMQASDGSMQANAFKRIGGGLVMILAPQIIAGFIG